MYISTWYELICKICGKENFAHVGDKGLKYYTKSFKCWHCRSVSSIDLGVLVEDENWAEGQKWEKDEFKDLAPDIVRKHLCVEITADRPFCVNEMVEYLEELSDVTKMIKVSNVIVQWNKNYGYSAYLTWQESGVHSYSFSIRRQPFLSTVLYTCKDFNTEEVIKFSKFFWQHKLIDMSWWEK